MICARLDAVSEVAESMGSLKAPYNSNSIDVDGANVTFVQPDLGHVLSSVLITLGRAPDIQRGITRIFHKTATTSEVEWLFLKLALEHLSSFADNLRFSLRNPCLHV